VLRALVDEFDADQNGCVSLAEFQAGLKMVDLCGLVAFARCAELRGALSCAVRCWTDALRAGCICAVRAGCSCKRRRCHASDGGILRVVFLG